MHVCVAAAREREERVERTRDGIGRARVRAGARMGLGMGLRGWPSREGSGQRPGGWALSSLSLLFSKKQKITKKRRRRKEVLGKKFDTRIIFLDSQKCTWSEKIEVGMNARFKFKHI